MAGKKDDKVSDDSADSKLDVVDDAQEAALVAEDVESTDFSEETDVEPAEAAAQDDSAEISDETSDDAGDVEDIESLTDGEESAQTDIEDALDEAEEPGEITSEAETPETTHELVPTPKPPEPEPRSVWPMVFAGILAAVLGFLAARGDLLDRVLPDSMRMGADVAVANDKIDALEAALGDASAKITEIEEQLANQLEVAVPETVVPEFDTSAIDDAIAALAERMDAIEARPVSTETATPAPAAPAPSFDAEFAALTAEFETLADMAKSQQAEIDRLLADARLVEQSSAEAANAALARAAATRIVAAVESGAPFAAALGDLVQTGVEIPEALQAVAENGVTQLSELQSQVPDVARTALAASREAEASGGFGGFLQRQLGARSVTPKEGSDPDAVLSRVEAAVREGRLNDALAEAETLPPEGQAAMADWLDATRIRLDVTTATEALMQRLAAN